MSIKNDGDKPVSIGCSKCGFEMKFGCGDDIHPESLRCEKCNTGGINISSNASIQILEDGTLSISC